MGIFEAAAAPEPEHEPGVKKGRKIGPRKSEKQEVTVKTKVNLKPKKRSQKKKQQQKGEKKVRPPRIPLTEEQRIYRKQCQRLRERNRVVQKWKNMGHQCISVFGEDPNDIMCCKQNPCIFDKDRQHQQNTENASTISSNLPIPQCLGNRIFLDSPSPSSILSEDDEDASMEIDIGK